MRTALVLLPVFLLTGGAAEASSLISLGDEITVPLPTGWALGSDSADFPFQLAEQNLGAEILVFKSVVWPEEAIDDEHDLRNSVETIMEDVIPTLPESQLLSSFGYDDGYRASFVLEFRSMDTLQNLLLRHRMMGVLYRHPEGHQLLFTLWGKSLSDEYPQHENAIKMVQEGFAYTGSYEDEVFGHSAAFPWYALAAMMAIVGLLYFFRSARARHDRIRFAEDKSFWRCEGCGRLNPLHHDTCRRCGRPRLTEMTT
jgi:hypothetical protein